MFLLVCYFLVMLYSLASTVLVSCLFMLYWFVCFNHLDINQTKEIIESPDSNADINWMVDYSTIG